MGRSSRRTRAMPPGSSNAEAASSSSFRARLRSESIPATSRPASPSSAILLQDEVRRQLAKAFAAITSNNTEEDGDNGRVVQLRDTLVNTGVELHSDAIGKITKGHADIQAKIAEFAEQSSRALSQANSLYSNIAYPLSATICESENLPRATIATHLSNLLKKLDDAEAELRVLGQE
ncbi:hypothetical protein S40288_01334 [Stachybotrys chartarum IBT 40288]|nr:hypothetical protein S40288_01334 [Stachybotrys chartarum IBT 40288]